MICSPGTCDLIGLTADFDVKTGYLLVESEGVLGKQHRGDASFFCFDAMSSCQGGLRAFSFIFQLIQHFFHLVCRCLRHL